MIDMTSLFDYGLQPSDGRSFAGQTRGERASKAAVRLGTESLRRKAFGTSSEPDLNQMRKGLALEPAPNARCSSGLGSAGGTSLHFASLRGLQFTSVYRRRDTRSCVLVDSLASYARQSRRHMQHARIGALIGHHVSIERPTIITTNEDTTQGTNGQPIKNGSVAEAPV